MYALRSGRHAVVVVACAALAAAGAWFVLNAATNQAEAWDNDAYWPTMFAVASLLGILFTKQALVIGSTMAATQLIILCATRPLGSTLGAGIALLVVLALVWSGFAWLGATARDGTRLLRRRLS